MTAVQQAACSAFACLCMSLHQDHQDGVVFLNICGICFLITAFFHSFTSSKSCRKSETSESYLRGTVNWKTSSEGDNPFTAMAITMSAYENWSPTKYWPLPLRRAPRIFWTASKATLLLLCWFSFRYLKAKILTATFMMMVTKNVGSFFIQGGANTSMAACTSVVATFTKAARPNSKRTSLKAFQGRSFDMSTALSDDLDSDVDVVMAHSAISKESNKIRLGWLGVFKMAMGTVSRLQKRRCHGHKPNLYRSHTSSTIGSKGRR
mmetsp:Transcript_74906/g.165433  ORF Transcript_74906/g.165433 Transcript_74906/m.165433 type:complete len:264 (-) Transcript_74906:221-1012(-)